MDADDSVQILFRFYSDLLEQEMVETLWALTVNQELGYYRIDSLPFYVPHIATDDIVRAEYDEEEEMLAYRETVKASGNSNVWVVLVKDEAEIGQVQDTFFALDCISEAISDRYFAMEVKAGTNYLAIKNKLNQLKADGILDYTESCFSAHHQY